MMAHVFRTTKPVGLLALVLGAMAFSASAAWAETGAHWNVNGTNFDSFGGKLSVELETAIEGVHGILLSTSGSTKVEILCTTVKLKDALLKANGGATGAMHFEGCIAKLNEKAAASSCKPHSPGATSGLIETNALDALIKLHTTETGKKVDLIELLPVVASQPIVMLILGSEGAENECALGELFDVTGKFFAKDAQEALLSEKFEHLMVEGPLSALLFGGNPATIDGSANLFLEATHKGLKFSGIAA